MRAFWGLAVSALMWAAWGQDALPPASVTLRIVDAAGEPVAGAQVGAILHDWRRLLLLPVSEPFWQSSDSSGVCTLRWNPAHELALREVIHGERRGILSLLVSAPNYQPCLLELTYPTPSEHTVVLRPARAIEVELRAPQPPPEDFGAAIPLREPKPLVELMGQPLGDCVVFSSVPLYHLASEALQYDWRGPRVQWRLMPGFGIERLTPTRYRIYLPSDVRPPLGLLINRPDWLWGYLATIDAQSLAQGQLTLDLPSSGALVARVNASQYPQLDSTRCRLSIIHTHPEISTPLILYSLPIDAPTKEVRLENLAPSSQWEIELWLFSRGNYYREQRRVRILPQETRTVTLRYTPYDLNRYKGNRRVVLRMLRRDGTPASNVPLQVRLHLPQYAQSIQVARGSTDAQGRLELKNLYELSAPAETRQEPHYIVSKLGDWQSIAEFTLTRDDGQQEILIVEPVRVGDSVSDVEFTDLRTGATRRLAEFQGQFVLLDFWATWCQPCHRALEELHREWQNLTPEQRERIKVVLVSIDDTRAGVLEFLKQRGWDTIGEPLWVPGWSAPAAMAFTVSSIPRQIIIDPQGRVAVLEAREPLAAILNMLEDNRSTGELEPSPN